MPNCLPQHALPPTLQGPCTGRCLLGMWAAGNKALHLHLKKCTPSSSFQLLQIMQEPWGDAGTRLLTAAPRVPHAVGYSTRDIHDVC